MAATNRSTVYSTQITHIGSGASMAAATISASTDISTALSSTNLGRYAYADIQLMVSNTGSVSSASNTILLYRRDLNFDGASDDPIPSTATSSAWSNKLVGAFVVPPWTIASTTFLQLTDVPIADQCEFYIENKLNTAIGLGWTLKVLPKTDSFA